MKVELTRFRVKKDKSAKVDEWLELLNRRMREVLLTLNDEKMYVETIFREKSKEGEFLYWYSVQGEGGAHVTESKHEIDRLHIEFSKECLDLDYKPQNIPPQVIMIADVVQKAIDEERRGNPEIGSKHFPIIFRMICDDPWFSYIQKGIKPVEGRKNTPKYQKVRVGDFIDFSNEKETFLAIVTDIRVYGSLESYLNDVTFQKALPGISSFEEAINIYHQWSTPEEIRKYGFLGIFIKPVDKQNC